MSLPLRDTLFILVDLVPLTNLVNEWELILKPTEDASNYSFQLEIYDSALFIPSSYLPLEHPCTEVSWFLTLSRKMSPQASTYII